MPRTSVIALATAALLLEALPLVAAHGHGGGHDGSDADMDMSKATQPQAQHGSGPRSYWGLSEHAGLMYMHIALSMIAWFVVLPVGVMMSIARSRLTRLVQVVFLVVNGFALLLGFLYKHRTPELYENNAHNKAGWAISYIALAWVVMALVPGYAGRRKAHSIVDENTQPMTVANMAQYQRIQDAQLPEFARWSNDSGQGTERRTASLYSHSRSPSVESENHHFAAPTRRYTHDDEDDENHAAEAERRGFLRNVSVDRFLPRKLARLSVGRSLKVIRILYVVIERTLLVQGLVALATGTVVYGGIGHGGAVFNVLAHYVKGGIFFGYGLLTLGRWMGAFADLGWAWNMKPPKEVVGRRRAALPSAEFTESFVIFLYGCTNVFLEHLAAWGDAWTPQDLEHVSISIMFFGGGLLGMLVESKRLRGLLNSSVSEPPQMESIRSDGAWQQPRQYGCSMNPVPGLIILLLGKMMSSHHQDSMLSGMIHSQWGTMFMGFALARGLTYITMYISPPTSFLPSRPPTEIITSFCLIAGGITFVVSNKDTVAALESYNLDAMFTFTVTMGLTALIMAWTTVLVAIKGWALRKETAGPLLKRNASTPA